MGELGERVQIDYANPSPQLENNSLVDGLFHLPERRHHTYSSPILASWICHYSFAKKKKNLDILCLRVLFVFYLTRFWKTTHMISLDI